MSFFFPLLVFYHELFGRVPVEIQGVVVFVTPKEKELRESILVLLSRDDLEENLPPTHIRAWVKFKRIPNFSLWVYDEGGPYHQAVHVCAGSCSDSREKIPLRLVPEARVLLGGARSLTASEASQLP